MNTSTRARSQQQELMEPSQEEIALRAHQIWCEQGCPAGHDLDNWLAAREQLVGSSKDNRGDSDEAELGAVTEEVPFGAFKSEAPLATKVAEQIVEPSSPGRRSKTSI